MAHDLPRARSGDGAGGDQGDHRHFHVEIAAHRGGNLPGFGERPGVFDFGNDRQRRFTVFLDLERSNTIVPDQTGGLLHHILDVMRVIVLSAENNHVLDAAADVELAVVEKSYVAGPKIAFVIGSIVDQPRSKLLQSQFGVIPVTWALAASGNPNLTDEV